MVKKVLVTGASGLLGSYLLKSAPSWADVYGTYYSYGGEDLLRLNILDKYSVLDVVSRVNPDIIIHCAGEGRVDHAEEFPEEAKALICDGTANLLWAGEKWGAHFVYISSNAVYDGEAAPYDDVAPQQPVNTYGKLKAEAEVMVYGYPHLTTVVRPILLYGQPPAGKRLNFVQRIIESLEMGESTVVAEDIVTQPTYAGDAAQAIWTLLQENDPPYFINIAPDEKMTMFRFASKIAEVFELDGRLLIPQKQADFPTTLAPRPRDTTYSLQELWNRGIALAGVDAGLHKMKEERKNVPA